MSGAYVDFAGGGYHTQLREWTTGLAPTTTRSSVSATSIQLGKTVTVGGRVVQGYLGDPVAYAEVELWQHVSGQVPILVARATADFSGLVNFVRPPGQDVWYTIKFQPTAVYGGSISPTSFVRVIPRGPAVSLNPEPIHEPCCTRTGRPVPQTTIAADAHPAAG